jgi:hypothetical protein
LDRNFHLGRWLGVFLGCAIAVQAQTDIRSLKKTFLSPPDDARVMMRWWWFGPAITQAELKREMEQMKTGGFGGFEIQPVYPLELDDPKSGYYNLPYLSDEFLNDVRFANDQAHRLGLRASLTLSSGWPYGGPHTPITEAAAQLRLIQTPVTKGSRFVVAPSLANGESLIAVFLADEGWNNSGAGEKPVMLALPTSGSMRMQLPAEATNKAHIVLWFLSSRTGQQVKRAAVDADGFVLDHFSREAIEEHLHNVADKLIAVFGDRPPYSVFSDSLEVYEADWTPNFIAQFRQRRGYDLLAHLPELFCCTSNEETLAVRHDWGETLTDLIDENYLQPIHAWAAAHHTFFRSQTYGTPAVSLSSNAFVDLPEGEGPQWRQFSFTRWATSASHVYGRPITSSETWTWLHSPAFRATPLDMKAEADRFFLQGINQLVGHGWPYSPPSAIEPGWRFYAAGAFNDHNPWWIVMPDIARYLQRVSWILRQGQPANDIAVYLPEDDAYAEFTPGKASLTALMPRWITPELTQAIEDSGYNFDYLDSTAIAKRGIRYPLLILPDVDRISVETLARIQDYQQHGGKVIALGRLPEHAPGLARHREESSQISSAARMLFHDATAESTAQLVPDVSHLGQTLQHLLSPDMQLSTPAPAIGFIHRKLADADIYFVANTGNTPIQLNARFRTAHRSCEWLKEDTGEARTVAMENGALKLDLAPYESRILLFHNDNIIHAQASTLTSKGAADLSDGWQVRFDGSGIQEDMPELASWTEKPQTRFYSGVATYRKTIELASAALQGTQFILSFGAGKPLPDPAVSSNHPGMQALLDPPIREAAVIYVNGRRAGSLWHPPYELNITSLLKAGDNELVVKVANTAINILSGQTLPDYRLLWARYGRRFVPQDIEGLQPLPSGLLGKIQLISRTQP